MAELPTSLIDLGWKQLTAYTLTVTDQAGIGRTVTVGSAGTWWRIQLAVSSASGATELLAKPFLNGIQTALNAALANKWQLSLTAAGNVQFKYLGTGTGSITLPTVIRNLLGFATDVSGLTTGAVQTGFYLPAGCLYTIERAGDDGWNPEAPAVAMATLPAGQGTYGWMDSSSNMRRKFDLGKHPRYWSSRVATSAGATPMLPDDRARWFVRAASLEACTPPFSLLDLVRMALGRRCGAALSNVQTMIATPAGFQYELVAIDEETIGASLPLQAMSPGYIERQTWKGFGVILLSPGTETI
jgi:hypothetical protein